jgi:hypothetical protein
LPGLINEPLVPGALQPEVGALEKSWSDCAQAEAGAKISAANVTARQNRQAMFGAAAISSPSRMSKAFQPKSRRIQAALPRFVTDWPPC